MPLPGPAHLCPAPRRVLPQAPKVIRIRESPLPCPRAEADPGPYRYLFSQHAPTGDPTRPPVDLPVFHALAESISRCQQAGLARAGDDPQWLAAQVWAALHGLVLLRLNALGFPWPGPLEQMADQAVARLIGLDTPADGHPA